MPVLTIANRRHAELARDVVDHRLGGGRGEGEDVGLPRRGSGAADLEEGRTEVVAPLRDAVRLVDDDQADRMLRDEVEERGVGEPLGRREHDPRLAGGDRLLRRVDLVGADRAVQLDGGDAELAQLVALVLHQRDQRRDDERRSGQEEGGKLVAERLARAGRHHRERRLARHHVIDHGGLALAQVLQAEGAAQQSRQARAPVSGGRRGVERARRGEEGMGRRARQRRSMAAAPSGKGRARAGDGSA